MAYQYGAPPGAYPPRQPGYSYGGPPPNMGPPPGMDGAPGMPSASPVAGSHPSQFQPPPNMPNINFNAPVIRLGVGDQSRSAPDRSGGRDGFRGSNAEPLGRRDRVGLGGDRGDGRDGRNLDRERASLRDAMMAETPPTREEVSRTIFIGGLGENAPPDSAIEEMLRCAGKLRRWTRTRDADGQVCRFGFAEYEDVHSLEAANVIFADGIEVPAFKGNAVVKDEETGEVRKMKILVVVDDESKAYIEEWKGRQPEEENARQFRLDGCNEDLAQVIARLQNAGAFLANGVAVNGDVIMADGMNGNGMNGANAEVINIPVSLEDDLSDIPADMRGTVAQEIKAFRDRSTKRDLERMKKEEEIEQAERYRSSAGSRINRLATPPGPSSSANGIPVGPRSAQPIPNAPSGPRGYRGAQLPSDYANGVRFVTSSSASLSKEEEEDPASDDELERRRQAKKDEEMQREFEMLKTRWQKRQRARLGGRDKVMSSEASREAAFQARKAQEKKRHEEMDDDAELAKLDRGELFYADRSAWEHMRKPIKDAESAWDKKDRLAEGEEHNAEMEQKKATRSIADDSTSYTSEDHGAKPSIGRPSSAAGKAGVKISLGAARTKANAAATAAAANAAQRRGMGDVEGLLEDEDAEAAAAGVIARPELKPLPPTSNLPALPLSPEEISAGRRALVTSIPTNTEELFSTPLKLNYLTPSLVRKEIRPAVEKRIAEYLGAPEESLVERVLGGMVEGREARALVEELENVFETDEAVSLVRKFWRLAVFWGECGGRGLLGE